MFSGLCQWKKKYQGRSQWYFLGRRNYGFVLFAGLGREVLETIVNTREGGREGGREGKVEINSKAKKRCERRRGWGRERVE